MEITGQTEKKISSAVTIASSVFTVLGAFPVLGPLAIASNVAAGGIQLVYSTLKKLNFLRVDREETLDKGFKKVLAESVKHVEKSMGKDSVKHMLKDINDILVLKIKDGEVTKSSGADALFLAVEEAIDTYCNIESEEIVQNEKRALIDQISSQFLISLAFHNEIGTYYNSINILAIRNELTGFESRFSELVDSFDDAKKEIAELRQAIDRLEELIRTTVYKIQLTPCGKPVMEYVAREGLADAVDEDLKDRALLIYAMGGVGKSEFCRYYADLKGKQGIETGWFDCKGSLKETFLSIGDPNKKISNELEDAEYQRVLAFLRKLDENTIIILDNVESLTQREINLLNALNCNVIITARDNQKHFWGDIRHIELKLLKVEDCILVFKNYFNQRNESDKTILEEETDTLQRIVQRAGRHTLAIELLAKIYAESPKYARLNALLSELQEKGFKLPELVTQNRDDEYRDFMKHFKKLFDLSGVLSDADKMHVLKNMAIIGSTPTPRDQLLKWIGESYQAAYKALVGSGWISKHNYMGYMHDMISEAVKAQSAPECGDCQRMIEVMAQELNFDHADLAQYNPPFFMQNKKVGDYFINICPSNAEISHFYHNIAFVYQAQGDYAKALEGYQKALTIKEEVLGKEHPNTATTNNNIAGVYHAQGDYPKALEWHKKALEIREKVLGVEHIDTAITYNNIAGVYDSQGDYPKALKWYEKALLIREKVLGKEHPNTATIYNNIAFVYQAQEDYAKALEGYQKALAIVEKVLGKEHPNTAATYHNIAGVYYDQGDYPKALEWYQKALEIREKVLGKEHPDTATTYNNIAMVYDSQGDYPKALEWYQKDLVISEKVLGKEHPNTATTYNNIAFVYDAQGDYAKALSHYKRAFNILLFRLGQEHPKVELVFSNLYYCYKESGRDKAKFEEWFFSED